MIHERFGISSGGLRIEEPPEFENPYEVEYVLNNPEQHQELIDRLQNQPSHKIEILIVPEKEF